MHLRAYQVVTDEGIPTTRDVWGPTHMREVFRQIPDGWIFERQEDDLLLLDSAYEYPQEIPMSDVEEALEYIEQVVCDGGDLLDLRPYQEEP